jgi:3-isopropylmalate/(R)-2-methylmalate dehydratase small subunit
MQSFTTIQSIAAPLPLKDVDTDMIIPAQYLTSISRDGFGENLFVRLRQNDAGFFMNQARFSGAQILVADSNFGCGSSREHAVWALLGAGIRVVIAPSFADIFTSNSAKNGLLLVSLEHATVHHLLDHATHKGCLLQVDLAAQAVTHLSAGSQGSTDTATAWSFDYDPYQKHCLLNGLDDLDFLRAHLDPINALKEQQTHQRFFAAHTPNRGDIS